MSEVIVRRALPADAPALAGLAALTFPLACPPGTAAKDIADFVAAHLSREQFEHKLADDGWFCAVAESGGALAGYTLTGFGAHADDGTGGGATAAPSCLLSKCYVAPSAQGTGVASRLLTFTLAHAAGRGAAVCWLGVNQHNDKARRFYEKHGFAVTGERTFQVGDQTHLDYVMQAPIPQAG